VSTLALAVHQLKYEQKSYWRNPAAAFFTFAFPVMFLVIFASLNTGNTVDFLGLDYNQYYVPGIICFGVISATYTNLAMTLSIRRDNGILKRLRGTPLPTGSLFGGLLLNAFVISAILTAIVMVVGIAFYDVVFPGHWPALIIALLVGAGTFCSLGVAISTVIPNADAAPAIVNGVLFPVLFLSGVFFPIEDDTVIAHIANIFPIRPFVNAVFTAFDPRLPHGVSHGYSWGDIGVMLIWLVAGAVVSVRNFRWEPAPVRARGRRRGM
jgi:ABC-2 type transport system permease protein